MARFQMVKSTGMPTKDGKMLELQWGRYFHEDGRLEHGYRFIWVGADGNLQAARGQARLPSLKMARKLIKRAQEEGWGDHDGDEV